MRNTPMCWRRATAALAALLLMSACTDPASGAAQAAPQALSDPCLTSDLTATITLRPAQPDSTVREALVALTNATAATCSLNGWLTMTLINAARQVVPVPATKLDKPTQPTTFELEAGGVAYTGLKWISCEKTSASCPVGANIRYSLSLTSDGPVATLTDFPTPKRTRITMSELRTGVLTPSSDQALTW
ncbi:DUF4232 domain-containing protein [Actinoplanes derwentensis]|uniref:DUF4232 domain-containing protein n=1 Tax=Actinoplanes derwentensis TaxID=113562 RepID=A0A1H2CIC5_9ACTN|nr:DUF4232 domain-containing protein [Actinoplanes derwentensis]GID88695.1 hypothetical protein Ade03nite_76190 [Actinoplanes derwentensis]SDT70007.1 Protein of unknown function [Actinoplanes derwentensis]